MFGPAQAAQEGRGSRHAVAHACSAARSRPALRTRFDSAPREIQVGFVRPILPPRCLTQLVTSPRGRPPLPLLIGFGIFVVAIVLLIASSMVPRDGPTFLPTPPAELALRGTADLEQAPAPPGPDTITIDASDAEQWRYFSFRRRALLEAPDTLDWDLAVRRYHFRVAGLAADLGPAGPGDTSTAGARFAGDDERDDAGHPAMRRWYRYGMLTHLLESRRHRYLVRTRDGGLASVEVLSYYCPGPRPGCMTFRYSYPLQ